MRRLRWILYERIKLRGDRKLPGYYNTKKNNNCMHEYENKYETLIGVVIFQ